MSKDDKVRRAEITAVLERLGELLAEDSMDNLRAAAADNMRDREGEAGVGPLADSPDEDEPKPTAAEELVGQCWCQFDNWHDGALSARLEDERGHIERGAMNWFARNVPGFEIPK